MLFSLNAFANEKGNGGDICEKRFKEIRSDIESWILRGGSKDLELPAKVSLKKYNQEMLSKTSSSKVLCTDKNLHIGFAPKTCVNSNRLFDLVKFLPDEIASLVKADSSESGEGWIICNSKKFLSGGEAQQYALVHHEYAGLAGFEVNKSEESNYRISNQVTGYLEDTTTKKLAIVKSLSCQKSLGYAFTSSALASIGGFSGKGFDDMYLGKTKNSGRERYKDLKIGEVYRSIVNFQSMNFVFPYYITYMHKQGLFSSTTSSHYIDFVRISNKYFKSKGATWESYVDELINSQALSFAYCTEKKKLN
jgi:hypothetical protein